MCHVISSTKTRKDSRNLGPNKGLGFFARKTPPIMKPLRKDQMLQVIDKKLVYVVDFATMPELPITGLTPEEQTWKTALGAEYPLDHPSGSLVGLTQGPMFKITYAKALTHAIENGVITEPGKYGIHLIPGTLDYEIYKIIE